MANSFGLNERPSRTSTRGSATLYQGSMMLRAPRSLRQLNLDPPSISNPLRRVENLQRNEISLAVVVENHAGLGLIALRDRGRIPENHRQGVGLRIVGHLHRSTLPYFASLLVRYAVTTSGGSRLTSTNT